MHSVKNRFLMRIKNATPGLYRHCWLPMTARDLVVVGGMPAGGTAVAAGVLAGWRSAGARPGSGGSEIMRRRRVSDRN